jgi:hypothetical protein
VKYHKFWITVQIRGQEGLIVSSLLRSAAIEDISEKRLSGKDISGK